MENQLTFEFKHLSLIEEKAIDVKTLPKEIQAKMRGWNMQLSKLQKSPSENLGKSLERSSDGIMTMINEHLESTKTPATPPPAPPKQDDPNDPKLQVVTPIVEPPVPPIVTPPAPIVEPAKTNGTKTLFQLLFGE